MKKLILILFLPLIISCSNHPNEDRTITYFDLKTYFEKEIVQLNKSNPAIIKTAINNDQKEIKTFQKTEWRKELQPFSELDINKPAWRNSYSIDTTKTEGSETLIYKAKEGSLTTRFISVKMKDQVVKEIEIRNVTINNLYHSTQVLKYIPGNSYYIIGTQKVRLLGETKYGVVSRFLN